MKEGIYHQTQTLPVYVQLSLSHCTQRGSDTAMCLCHAVDSHFGHKRGHTGIHQVGKHREEQGDEDPSGGGGEGHYHTLGCYCVCV